MAGQGDSPLSTAWLSRRRYRNSSTSALVKQTSADSGATVWSDYFFPAASGGAVSANLSKTLDAVTLSATAVLPINGIAAITLGDVTLSSAAVLAINATESTTLDAVTLSSTAKLAIQGTLSASLADVTLSSSASLAIQGSLAVSLDEVSLSATGTVESAPAPVAVQVIRGADGRKEFETKQDKWRDELHEIIEAAFATVAGDPGEPVSEPVKKEIARAALPIANMDGIEVSLKELIRLVDQYERELIQKRQEQDDEELFMLMAA